MKPYHTSKYEITMEKDEMDVEIVDRTFTSKKGNETTKRMITYSVSKMSTRKRNLYTCFTMSSKGT